MAEGLKRAFAATQPEGEAPLLIGTDFDKLRKLGYVTFQLPKRRSSPPYKLGDTLTVKKRGGRLSAEVVVSHITEHRIPLSNIWYWNIEVEQQLLPQQETPKQD